MKMQLMRILLASTCFMAAGAAVTTALAAAETVPVAIDGIGGTVTGAKGPEAGVWVIAETADLPTRFIKIVVTDDQGRFMLPELPKAKYKVWVRGYGLVDSKPVEGAMPGKTLNLKSVQAPDAKSAAQYYPANYWLSLIHVPDAGEFPGTGATGNGIAPTMKSQQEWLALIKDGCVQCHQQGDKATRELANNSEEGWAQRIMQSRDAGDLNVGDHGKGMSTTMQNNMAKYGRERGLKMFADWTQRIEKGALPAEVPPRPTGVERNVVISLWDWSNGGATHDEIASDRRNPRVNANGPIFAASGQTGHIAVLDPKTSKTEEIKVPGFGPTNDTFIHNPMIDHKGRLWLTDIGRIYLPPATQQEVPDYCNNEAGNKFAKYYPLPGKQRGQIVMYDPASKQMTQIPGCFTVHHLGFGVDKNDTLYFSGDPGVVGWVDTKVWDETRDPSKAIGWCPMVLDTKERGATKVALTDGDVAITPDRKQWNELGKTLDPKKDTQLTTFRYGMDVNMVDGSLWFSKYSPFVPSGFLRFERGSNPPETCKSEYYEPPKLPDGTYAAWGVKGVGIDSKGIVWAAFNSGQFASFDRSKCKVTRGPAATGQQCPEGWKFYQIPGPTIAGTKNVTSDYYYLGWMDLYDTLGLGKDIPVAPGTNSDSIVVFMPDTGKMVTIRVPYPMGFFGRGMDGRIDDPNTGWKGKGMWASYNMAPVWHQEGGEEGYGPELVKLQVRPDPLAH